MEMCLESYFFDFENEVLKFLLTNIDEGVSYDDLASKLGAKETVIIREIFLNYIKALQYYDDSLLYDDEKDLVFITRQGIKNIHYNRCISDEDKEKYLKRITEREKTK